MRIRGLIVLFALLLAACGQAPATTAPVADATSALQTGLNTLATTNIEEIEAAIDKNDQAAAKAAFEDFDEGWEKIEDGVKDVSADSYKAIEDAMESVEDAVVRSDTLNAADAKAATEELQKQIEQFVSTLK